MPRESPWTPYPPPAPRQQPPCFTYSTSLVVLCSIVSRVKLNFVKPSTRSRSVVGGGAVGHHKRRRRLKPKRRRPLTVYTGLKPTGGDYTSRRPGGRGLCVTIGPKEGMSAARRLGRTLIVAGNQWLWRKYTKERSDFATARDARLIILDWINDKAQHGHATYHASCFISVIAQAAQCPGRHASRWRREARRRWPSRRLQFAGAVGADWAMATGT